MATREKIKAIKGCLNEDCIAFQKRINFKANDKFCSKCGQPLFFVCKDCRMKLDNGTKKYCIRCENKHKDDSEQLGKVVLKKIGAGAKVVKDAAIETGKKAEEVVLGEDGKFDKTDINRLTGGALEKVTDITDKVKNTVKKKDLTLPKEYKKIKGQTPSLGFPAKDITVYRSDGEQCSSLVIKAIVPEEVSMDFDNPESTIDQLHRNMPDNGGLIEVKNGVTKNGFPYIYFILKHHMDYNGIPQGNEYSMNVNIKHIDKVFFINSSFSEKGITGLRDSTVYAIYQKKLANKTKPFEGWFKDPYDSSFEKGFLMNESEKEEYDKMFPDHPLSKAREFVKYVVNNN